VIERQSISKFKVIKQSLSSVKQSATKVLFNAKHNWNPLPKLTDHPYLVYPLKHPNLRTSQFAFSTEVTILGTTEVIYAEESKDTSLISPNPPITAHISNAQVVYFQKDQDLIVKFSNLPGIIQTIVLANVAKFTRVLLFSYHHFFGAHQLLHAIYHEYERIPEEYSIWRNRLGAFVQRWAKAIPNDFETQSISNQLSKFNTLIGNNEKIIVIRKKNSIRSSVNSISSGPGELDIKRPTLELARAMTRFDLKCFERLSLFDLARLEDDGVSTYSDFICSFKLVVQWTRLAVSQAASSKLKRKLFKKLIKLCQSCLALNNYNSSTVSARNIGDIDRSYHITDQ
jgi:hypothetical protein